MHLFILHNENQIAEKSATRRNGYNLEEQQRIELVQLDER
jgi:hypothetical protein